MEHDICMMAGDSRIISVSLTDKNRQPISLLDADIVFQLARRVDMEALVTKSLSDGVVISNTSNGHFEVNLEPIDTEDLGGKIYYYEIQVTLGNGVVNTVLRGNLDIEKSLIPSI